MKKERSKWRGMKFQWAARSADAMRCSAQLMDPKPASIPLKLKCISISTVIIM